MLSDTTQDAYNVMTTDGDHYPYLRVGMAGRPTRTLIEFIAQTVCREKLKSKELKKYDQSCP